MKSVLLYNIRSRHNVGSVFRTADGAGVNQIFLYGYTPRPVDRFGRLVEAINKTALGASEVIPWFEVEVIGDFIKQQQAKGIKVVAIEQSAKSVVIADYQEPDNVLYILGSEVEGLPEEVLAMSDIIVELPMCGTKESLNVSVTAGIVLYHALTRKK